MEKITNQFSSIEQVTSQYLNNKTVNNTSQSTDVSFEDVLRQTALERETGLKFSKHASMRLNERDIILTQNQSTRLENGVDAASKKGINDSLVLVDNLAFIVNVPNKTVVTAMDQTETNSNVFTNIDGAVIM
ncbi:MAG: flagellar protein [Lachnobacterium sp.]|nr:flagellar protein [Lachnobacterium sp.]MDD6632272.1 flagellar protein [Lachnobacterium sp.]MDY2912121.1 TIGR02530 family flagellar biosynthesis protein [Agathobacter sp.]